MQQGMRSRLACRAGTILLTMAAMATATAGQPPPDADARAWIQRMNTSLVEGNYDGVFELRSGTWRRTYRIVHRFKDGEMRERLVATDGSGEEQRRKGPHWAQFLPDMRLVRTATRNRVFGYIHALNGLDDVAARQ
jgi:negative regulator of sigma E activity